MVKKISKKWLKNISKHFKNPYQPILALFFTFLILVGVYHFVFADSIIPGVRAGYVDLGGLTFDQAKTVLLEKDLSTRKVLTLRYEDQVFEIAPEDIGLVYRWDFTLARAFEVGRTGNFFIDTKDKIAGIFFKTLNIKAVYDMDTAAFNQKLTTIKGEINVPYTNAQFTYDEGELIILPSGEGLKVIDQHLYDQIIFSYDRFDFTEKRIRTEVTHPKVLEEDLEAVKGGVEELVQNPIRIVYGRKEWRLTPEQIIDFVTVDKKDGGMELAVNKLKVDAYTETLGYEVNELPRGRVTAMEGNQVTGFEITKNGRELDSKKFGEDFRNALFNGTETVEISLIEVTGEDNPAKYGISELIGVGNSNFRGSAAGRIKNLTLAAERTSGILVPPGATYSFNRSVGAISAATGYDQAYIIRAGRTVLGEGGGVCQTSTTLFRAILNAGLPITERHPHAYRVSYYELDSQVGFDAAIYQPSLDLQFRNDTENYILVQASWNLEANTLTFRLYGTSDGREVKISDPVVSNVIPAPEALYQDDDTLPEGTIRQIDFAAAGANVYFTREVTRDGEVLYEDTITSRFQPWRAVFLVGTKKN
jgi:vancomycin resistance protein YoaR